MRKLKQEPCIDCGKMESYTTGRCRVCWSKYYRTTKTGKAGMEKYNKSDKAIAARKRYKDKLRAALPPKPPKTPKPLCDCGKKSVAKGLCSSCYNRARYKANPRPRREGALRRSTTGPNIRFEEVLDLVGKGYTVSKALNKLSVCSSWFYKNITAIQKQEIRMKKALSKI